MNKSKLVCLTTGLILCLAISSGLIARAVVRAQPEEQTSPPEETLEVSTKYPVLSGAAGEAFNFEVQLKYRGGVEPHPFDLSVEGPAGWLTYIQKGKYEEELISAISLTPALQETILVVVMAPPWAPPEPGEYAILLEAVERETGEPRNSFDLVAEITASYAFTAETTTGRLNIKATAGKESHLSIIITNTGTAALGKITSSSSKPSGIAGEEWSVTFEPDKIESLSPWDEQEVEVTIKPPSKTIAGDYMTTLQFDSDPKPSTAPPKLDIRVTVGTPTKWGWIGAGIVVAVIAGLVIGFRQLGRR
ncbi:MAG: NEW3 domain-containing protein [Dehalococcoidia bacterium]|nr:NEW3 domain-containing protein [Dehalococcoidia bacterium]